MTTLSLEDLERDLAASAAGEHGPAPAARPDISDLAALWCGGERERALELADAWRKASGPSPKVKT